MMSASDKQFQKSWKDLQPFSIMFQNILFCDTVTFFLGCSLACTAPFDSTLLKSQTCIWLKSTVGLIKDKLSHLFSYSVLSISSGMTTMGGWQTWLTPRAGWAVTALIQTVQSGCKPRAPTKRTSQSPPTSRPQEPSTRSCKVRISAKPFLNTS